MLCSLCNHDPCKAIVFGQMLEGELSVINVSLDTSKKRNQLYRTFIAAEHGILGHRVHISIPKCEVAFICCLIPSPDNRYTCHHDIDEEGNETDQNNESFEEATPDLNINGIIDYASGENLNSLPHSTIINLILLTFANSFQNHQCTDGILHFLGMNILR